MDRSTGYTVRCQGPHQGVRCFDALGVEKGPGPAGIVLPREVDLEGSPGRDLEPGPVRRRGQRAFLGQMKGSRGPDAPGGGRRIRDVQAQAARRQGKGEGREQAVKGGAEQRHDGDPDGRPAQAWPLSWPSRDSVVPGRARFPEPAARAGCPPIRLINIELLLINKAIGRLRSSRSGMKLIIESLGA